MEIRVVERNVFGIPRLYPASPGAETLAQLTRTKTLELEHLRAARALGHTITVEYAQPALRAKVEAINTEGETL